MLRDATSRAERFGEGDLPALGCGVIRLPGVAHLTCHRRHVDDASVRLRIMCWTAAFEQLNVTLRFVLMTASQSVSDIIMIKVSLVMPALLTRMLRSPNVSTRKFDQRFGLLEIGDVRLKGGSFTARLLDLLYHFICGIR